MSDELEKLSHRLASERGSRYGSGLDVGDVDPNPFAQFARWTDEALAAGSATANAMTLATAGANGEPSARIVLLKGVEDEGFVFFTNYESRKGRDLAENPRAAAVFFWPELSRQVCVAGDVERLAEDRSDAYFASRPLGSRLGAWVSPQSRPIPDRAFLDARVGEIEARFAGRDIPRPPYWGGFVLVPLSIELWQGRPNRLHDRLRYVRSEDGWLVERLAP